MPKFTAKDFADQSFFNALDKALKDFKEFAATARSLSKDLQNVKGFKAYSEAAKKAGNATDKLTASEKKLKSSVDRLAFAQSKAGKEHAKNNELIRRQTADNKKLATSQLSAVKSTNRFGSAIKSFLFKANFLANVMSNLVSTIGRQFVRAVKQAFNVIKDFDKGTARLASVVGKTRKEIEGLTKQSKELGSTTQFTATQVNSLQIELAKLGFVANEIKAATPAILSFATATGANLAEAAKTAGAAVRIFGLSASETKDAVATLAVATTKSGLTFEAYDTILSTVGPVAKAYGFTLADVVALTGELATAGFEANKAATATRNILLNLADAGGSLAQELGGAVDTFDGLIDGMVTLDKRGISLAETLELTDKRSVAAFSRFLEGAESARTLRDGIVDVNDELDKMVKMQLDTIAGDIDLLKSAWEGLILSFGGSTGPIRYILQFLTDFTLKISNLGLLMRRFNKQSLDDLAKTFDLLAALTDAQGDHFDEMIEFFDKFSDEGLASRGIKQMAKDFALIRRVNQKEGLALAEEYLRRRKVTTDAEIQLTEDKLNRITNEEERSSKKIAVIYENVSEQLKQIKKDELESFIEDDEEYINFSKKAWETIAENTKGAFEHLEDLVDLRFDNEIERLNELSELEDIAFQKKLDREQQLSDVKKTLANEGFVFLSILSDRRIQKLEAEAKAGIISEEKLAKEKNRINRQTAFIDKAQALFNIGINTAVAVTKALATNPLLVPFVVALGLAQSAAVIATPIPQFAKGVKSSPAGAAVIGEEGPELMIHGGHVGLSPGVPTLTNLKKGTEIIPADITSQMLKYTAIANGFEGKADDRLIIMMADKLDRVERAIKSQPVRSSTITPAGILTATHRGNTTIKKIDKYFK